MNKILFSLCLSLCSLRLVLPVAFLNGRFFWFLEHSTPRFLNVTSDHSCRIVSFSGLKMVFSKLSQVDITACIKNCVYNNFNLCSYFMFSIIERLYRSSSLIYSSAQIYLELKILKNSSTIFRSSYRRCSIKKLFLKILWYSQENTCVGVSFLLKLWAFRPLTILKRDFNTDIFLWISGNF